jgi:hypothetical protein
MSLRKDLTIGQRLPQTFDVAVGDGVAFKIQGLQRTVYEQKSVSLSACLLKGMFE